MRELLRRLFSDAVIAAELLVATLFVSVLGLAGTLYSMNVMNRYLAHGVDGTLATLTVGVVIAGIVEYAFREVRQRLAETVCRPRDAALAGGAFAALTGARLGVLERLPAPLRQETMRGLDDVQNAYGAANLVAMLDVPFAAIAFLALWILHPLLALASAIALAAAGGLGLIAGARLGRLAEGTVRGATASATLVAAGNAGADTVRAFRAGEAMRVQWAKERDDLAIGRAAIGRIQAGQASWTTLINVLLTAAVTAIGAVLVLRGDISVGAMFGATFLAARALQPVARAGMMAETFGRAARALREVEALSRLPTEADKGTQLAAYKGRVEFKDLAFAFGGSTGPLFESFDLAVQPGQVVVVVGPNGSGKTTLARLLMGLLEPTRGQILVDGVDLRQIAPDWWRRQASYVPQEPGFVPGTVGFNIVVARPEIDDEHLGRILKAADLKTWLDGTPQGLGAPLADLGRSLSPGIRRRLALARALVVDGPLILIDEPQDGLDAAGIAAMSWLLNDLRARGRTIFVFCHDPKLVAGADIIIDLGKKPVPDIRPNAKPPVQVAGLRP